MRNKEVFKITLSGVFLALAFVLPFLTGQIPEIGSMLCPMHIPVLLCGFICGWKYGLIVGFVTPLLRSVTLSMPPLYPTALAMAFELATYGVLSGLLYNLLPKEKFSVYPTLLISMIGGRIVWGLVMVCLMGFDYDKFGLSTFWLNGFANAFPGIILQIVLVPIIVIVYNKFVNNESGNFED